MQQIGTRKYLSDLGKVFIQKNTGKCYGWSISLSSSDSIDNYEEKDCPEECKGRPECDNTITEDDINFKLW